MTCGHEHASRLVERGVPLSQVRDLRGHGSISTTERYDNQKLEALHAAVARLESGEAFDPTRPMTGSKFQVFFKNGPGTGVTEGSESTGKTPSNSLKKRHLDEWLGGRDSNPDYTVQSRVSYH